MKRKKERETGLDAEKDSLQNSKKGKKFSEEGEYLANDEEKIHLHRVVNQMRREQNYLASINGHKGISGFLAELFFTSHLELLTMEESKDGRKETSVMEAMQTVSEHITTLVLYGDGQVILEDLEVEMRKQELSRRYAIEFESCKKSLVFQVSWFEAVLIINGTEGVISITTQTSRPELAGTSQWVPFL
ncbi:hypothetical protein LR48_Vigan08g033000 [Vigna angularis]|uniref:Uncharacterized protein n=1 Tax=Phaseolus angularis TaxID=3914 RepID=A0A0L9V3A1_PHAAN|nr:hypothetical protein LR48_Vigan08g033000 [Vigna angularis]